MKKYRVSTRMGTNERVIGSGQAIKGYTKESQSIKGRVITYKRVDELIQRRDKLAQGRKPWQRKVDV